MAGDTIVTIVGNLTDDPSLKLLQQQDDDPWSVGNAGIGGKFPTDEPAF